jgi:hypothetical protein
MSFLVVVDILCIGGAIFIISMPLAYAFSYIVHGVIEFFTWIKR